MFEFTPDEEWLPTDPRLNGRRPDGMTEEEWLRGGGAGAPIFYRVRRSGRDTVDEHWVYRRNNEYRGKDPFTRHRDDFEAYAVLLRDGVPVRRGYSQHEAGCSVSFDSVPSRVYAGEGSAAMSPFAGAADHKVTEVKGVPLPLDVNPMEELWGAAPGQRTPRRNTVDSASNLVDHDRARLDPGDLIDRETVRLPANESNGRKFEPDAAVWDHECDRPRPRR